MYLDRAGSRLTITVAFSVAGVESVRTVYGSTNILKWLYVVENRSGQAGRDVDEQSQPDDDLHHDVVANTSDTANCTRHLPKTIKRAKRRLGRHQTHPHV